MSKTHWKRPVSRERLVSLLSYDANTGSFVWLANRRCIRAGTVAGTVSSRGYLTIKIDGLLYPAHRLAWFYVNGVMPDKELDHINRRRLDNRIGNLRLATSGQNKLNTEIRTDNLTGVRGVSYCATRKKFVAQIAHQGKKKNLGRYASLSEAQAAYEIAALNLHGEFAAKELS